TRIQINSLGQSRFTAVNNRLSSIRNFMQMSFLRRSRDRNRLGAAPEIFHIIYSENMTKVSKVDLVGVGLNATDTLIPLAIYPALGSKVEYQTATVAPGGQVATTVIACQHWGMRTRYVGKLGDDDAARLHREAFSREGVETQLITVAGGASPQSLILVD